MLPARPAQVGLGILVVIQQEELSYNKQQYKLNLLRNSFKNLIEALITSNYPQVPQ